MPLWAGEGVGAMKEVQQVADIVQGLVRDAEQCLRRWC